MDTVERPAPRIVVGVDTSDASKAALRWAIRQAEATGATVEAVMAWERPTGWYGWAPAGVGVYDFEGLARKSLDRAVTHALEGVPPQVRIDARTIEGHPAAVLLDQAQDAALLVVGDRGLGTFTRALLGSVCQHCVHHAACPVVVVRAPRE
ncbi:universal stress protein [Streptacidiphilus pinicola]|uniref:Universal stress protein n=1 Tax=Streptacidiphilus pinicola TaxID=2219663 RepID=A0A2X0K746_9ACTN|nr:universal stress protein [Streptacidiphilus pinicola]RAG83349.1 universal stress protein [Streptacidiphilus pinicola]